MIRSTFLHILILICASGLSAQSIDPNSLKSPEDHLAFFDTIFNLHQELLTRSGPVISTYGWESTEHLALRDSTLKRNAYLREIVDKYLDLYGFPTTSAELLEKRKLAQSRLLKDTQKIDMQDSLARDSLIKVMIKSYGSEITFRDAWPTVMLVLDTEPNFEKRCENISWLRFEWEEGHLPTQSLLAYLRHTYAARHGKELDIATGSTERERIFMHARELSGCWGS